MSDTSYPIKYVKPGTNGEDSQVRLAHTPADEVTAKFHGFRRSEEETRTSNVLDTSFFSGGLVVGS